MKVKEWLETFQSENTRRMYKHSLKAFFSSIYGEGDLNQQANRYFKEKREYERDITSFFVKIKEKPPKTIKLYLSAAKSFLMENGIELKQNFWKKLGRRIKGTRAITIDKVPTNEELKHILDYMPIQGKALYLTLASSGMRIGEALRLEMDDLDLNQEPAKINIQASYTKSGNSRIAFISSEAKRYAEDWLKQRDRYLKVACSKSKLYEKPLEDKRLFPFDESTARVLWMHALDKNGYGTRDKATHRLQMHPHCLRKFFRTRLGEVIPVDIVEALMGHEGYLTEVYRRYDEAKLGEFYKEGEHVLHIFSNIGEIAKVKAEMDKKTETLGEVLARQIAEKEELKKQLAEMRKKDEELEKATKVIDEKLSLLLESLLKDKRAREILREKIRELGV
jgi:integrase